MKVPTPVLLNLHRPYFAQALHDSPHDTHKHRYLPSVAAIYRASWRIVHGLQFAWTTVPQILARLHLPWSQALSAAVRDPIKSTINHRLTGFTVDCLVSVSHQATFQPSGTPFGGETENPLLSLQQCVILVESCRNSAGE